MYVPAHFQEDRIPLLHDAIRQSGFGTLVTLGADGIEASHIPMLIDATPSPLGTLRGHIARANPQWRRLAAGTEALAMFLGPNFYVTPSWYATKRIDGEVVPTWNYTAIHAYGAIEFFDDPKSLLAIVTDLTELHEGKRAEPWAVSDAPADYVAARLRGIVGFRLIVARLEGKKKLSQNRPEEDIAGVREGLEREGEAGLAALMADKGGT